LVAKGYKSALKSFLERVSVDFFNDIGTTRTLIYKITEETTVMYESFGATVDQVAKTVTFQGV
jgi:hypothetical protein